MARYGFDPETGRLNIHPDFWKDPDPNARPTMGAATPDRLKPPVERGISLPEWTEAQLPTGASRDAARMALHGLARTGNTILKFLDIPNRVFGNTRSVLQDIYERSEANLERDTYEDRSGVPQVAETAVHLASAGVLGKALPAVFGANVGADTYETAKYAGASEGEALAKGLGHGVVDTAIWTLGQGLASKYLPKAWQWLGRELTGAMRGAASSATSDAMLNSLGADISGEEMAKRAVHAAWMVPLLGMLKMGGKRREEAMSLLRKARPDLAGAKADRVIETIEAEFSDPKSQKVALAWVARKGANLPDDTAQIRQALEVSSKVKGLDPMSRSPFEILSDPAYARYLPRPRPQDVKAFSNMRRYPMGVIGFDVSDDAAGRQATREMINAYMSPSSNPWCLATGKDAERLGGLGPDAEGYWESHSAVPKQIFFQEVDGKLELTAFRAASSDGVGRQEYWDTSDAGYSGIPIKVKVPGDPMGRYRKMVFRPEAEKTMPPETVRVEDHYGQIREMTRQEAAREISILEDEISNNEAGAEAQRRLSALQAALEPPAPTLVEQGPNVVRGTFEDIAPGKVFKGDPFRDGRSQTWVKNVRQAFGQSFEEALGPELAGDFRSQGWTRSDETSLQDFRGMVSSTGGTPEELSRIDRAIDIVRAASANSPYVLVEDKVRTTENGITRFRTTKYADPTGRDYEPPKPGEAPKPVEIEESELVSPEWMRSRGYDPDSESDVGRMQRELDIQTYGNGVEAAMAVVPTRRTYMQTKSGTPETVTYGPNGRAITAVDFVKDGVPYREEYDYAGPNWDMESPYSLYPGDTFYQLPRPEYGEPLTAKAVNRRLIRNPGTEMAEVLDDVRVDEGLGGFVRTSGNRRWRIGLVDGNPDGITPLDALHLASSLVGADSNVRLSPALQRHRETLVERIPRDVYSGAAASDTMDNLERIILDTLPAANRHDAFIVEDRRPDGTWSVTSTSDLPSSSSSERGWDELPFPPEEIPYDGDGTPMFAAKAGRTRRDVQVASKAGDADRFALSRNFLATDEVPDSIFGIPIVSDSDDYTPEDIAFFHSHPEAGGYYDLGEGTPEDGSAEGAPVQADAPRRKPEETFDTPIPKELRARYGAWYAQLPERLQYTGDYDLQGAWLERLGRPDKYEASQDGHLDDYGKKPNHITFSTESKWHDPKVPERAGGEWKQAEDGSWDFYPGTGNKASDDELKAYFDKYERGNRVHKRETREANGTGKTKRKIPPIVKGPLHYGPPPPPSRGPYPGVSNNPGNVEKHERRKDGTLFPGEVGGGVRPKRFAVFGSPIDGLNATAAVLARRAAELRKAGKPFTIENYAPRYAPPTENDTEAYIQNLSRYSGIARDAAIDLSNAADMKNLLKTVVRFESGEPHSAWFTDDEYDRAVRQVEPNRGDAP